PASTSYKKPLYVNNVAADEVSAALRADYVTVKNKAPLRGALFAIRKIGGSADHYLNAVLLPSLCQVNTWNSNSFRSPCSFQEVLPVGVSMVLACRYCATLVGSVLPEPLMASAMTCVAA